MKDLVDWRRCAAWIALGFCCARGSSATGGRTAFRLFGDAEGLSNTSVERLLQDRDGFLWIGTQDGLFRFDGRGFSRFGREEGLPSSRINDLFESSRGTLLVGTRAGLARRAGDGFIALGPAHGMPEVPISDRGIAESASGDIYVATQKGLFRGDGERFAERALAGSPGGRLVTALLAARDGALLVAVDRRLIRLQADHDEDFGASRGLAPSEQIDEVAQDAAGRLWVRTLSELWVLEPGGRRFTRRDADLPAAIGSGRIDVDPLGHVMLPTSSGLLVQRGESWQRLGVAEGLPAPAALASLVDREGTLWVGLAGAGLAQRLGSGSFTSFGAAEGLSHDVVWGIARAAAKADRTEAEGRATPPLWLATEDGLSRADFTVDGDLAQVERVAGTRGTYYAVAADPDGSVWAGSWPGGVTRFGPQAGRIRRYDAAGHDSSAFKVIALHVRHGEVWAGASDGVYRLDPSGIFAPMATAGGAAPDSVFAFAEWQGELWCAGRFGLQRLTGPAPRRYRVHDGLRADFLASLAALPDGSLWAGYREALGIERLRLSAGRLAAEPLTTKQGLRSDKVLFLGLDGSEHVWIGTSAGVDLASPQGRLLAHYGRADGMPTEDMDQNAFYGGDRDAVWLGSSRGLVRLDARARAPLPAPIPIKLTEAWSGPRRLALDAAASLQPTERSLLVRWAGLSFVDLRRMRFRYRLEGLEDQQTETAVPEARFSALPAGHYRFTVVAVSGAGKTSLVPASLEIEVAPRWWERTAARLLFGLLAVALIAGIVVLRTRALELDRLRLEKAIAERSEELEAALREVAELSLTDPLTQARNRRFLVASIGREVARAKRDQASNKPAADRGILFLLVDLDFFKEVNDRSGHAAGDRVLIEASRRIAGVGRESDFLVRWGGEEFLLVVPDAGFERGPLMAQRILDTFRAAPFDLGDGSSLRQSCSIGWAPFPWVADGSSGSPSPGWEAVVDLADRALYVAKREGRDRAVGVLPLQGSKPTEKALDLADGEAMRLVRSGALAQPAGASSSGASGP